MSRAQPPIPAPAPTITQRFVGAALIGLGLSGVTALILSAVGAVIVPLIWLLAVITSSDSIAPSIISHVWLGSLAWYAAVVLLSNAYGWLAERIEWKPPRR